MLIDLRNKDISGKKADQILGEADITVNKNMVPFDTRSPFVTSGIRVGTPAVTTRGMKEAQMVQIVDWIDQVISQPDNAELRVKIKGDIHEMMKAYPLFQYH